MVSFSPNQNSSSSLVHFFLLDFIRSIYIFGDKYKIRRLSSCNFLYHFVTFSSLGSSILLSTQFSIKIHILLLRIHHSSYLLAEAFQNSHSLNVVDFVWRSETLLQFMVHYLLRNTHTSPSVSYIYALRQVKNISLPSKFFSFPLPITTMFLDLTVML